MFSTHTEITYFIYNYSCFYAFYLALMPAYASKNEDMTHYQSKLEKLQKSITKIQEHLKGSKKQRSHVVTELQYSGSRDKQKCYKTQKDRERHFAAHATEKQAGKRTKATKSAIANQRTALSEQLRVSLQHGASAKLKNATKSTGSSTGGQGSRVFQLP